MQKILVIQLRQLGDVLMTTPVVRQLRKIYPAAQIDFLTEKLGANVYRYNPHVNNLKIIPRKAGVWDIFLLTNALRKEKYDLTVDCFSNPKSAQITFLSAARESVGFALRFRAYAYSQSLKLKSHPEYAAISKLRLIEKFGADLNDFRIELPVSSTHYAMAGQFANRLGFDDKTVAFCAVSRRDYKVWNPDHFARVGDWLIGRGYKLFLVYGPGEKDLALNVYHRLQNKSKAIIDYPMPDILELRAILEKCVLYVGNDGGNKHVAICAGIPTVTVFGSIRWQSWTPPGSATDHAVYKNMDCYDQCHRCTNMRCYKALTAQDLIAKLEEVLM
ncbi:MAG TPA: glycosyltransferase family 9 protein [Smithella sp.]|nr:glycosyltransferase family 9 protein [Smithella sp.]HNY49691.1 glycosyltransferase family 9 protein [Smithella sp.]HOG89263.1 glycosyltransferase family 9 protein [Smithella sp.]HOU50851.1 glycosyltransferase family 9 protein [Smithella sp.]HQG64878.1 glycosyltransferase family 9 protein [Smithella sp.]